MTTETTSLRVADRCDRCGAQAFVGVLLASGSLLFCGHHYAKHEDDLTPIAIAVVDERHRLTENNRLKGAHTC